MVLVVALVVALVVVVMVAVGVGMLEDSVCFSFDFFLVCQQAKSQRVMQNGLLKLFACLNYFFFFGIGFSYFFCCENFV